jgi:hypothetical protein
MTGGLAATRGYHSAGRLLETHFDDNNLGVGGGGGIGGGGIGGLGPTNGFHVRSTSHSNVMTGGGGGGEAVNPAQNLNHSFPGCDNSSNSSSGPYISASVMLPAREELGFYQNLSGRIKQQQQQQQQQSGYGSQRSSFSRQGGGDSALHKSPRTQELEEFAAKFEGYQMQRRQGLPSMEQLYMYSPRALMNRQVVTKRSFSSGFFKFTYSIHCKNVEIGTEAAQFTEKEYINGIFVAMYDSKITNPVTVDFIYFSRCLVE